MFRYSRLLRSAALAISLLAPVSAFALDEAEKEEIGAFIREYLIENPEIMIEVQQALEAKQMAAQQARAGEAIAANREQIFNAPHDIALGNPEGDVTIVEFFDYNCGYCRRAHADMQAMIDSDPDLRFVLKEFPILGPDSMAAHRVSMAFKKIAPEKYEAFQNALMTGDQANEETALAVAAELGVAEDELRPLMDDPSIDEEIRSAYQLADALGISGTPSYVIGDEAVYGAMGAEMLVEKVENMRRCESATC